MIFDAAAYEVAQVPVEAQVELVRVRGLVTSAPTTTGWSEIRVPLVQATPKAAIFIVSLTTLEDGSFAAGRGQTITLSTGAAHAGIGMSSTDAVATTDANRVGQDIGPIFISGAAGSTVGLAGFLTWVPGGVRVSWIIAPGSAYRITSIFFFGDDVQAGAGTVAPGATTDPDVSVSVGFKPDLLFAVNALEFFGETFQSSLAGQLGIAVRDLSTDLASEYGFFMDSEDNVATSNVRGLQYQGGVAQGLVTDSTTFRKTHVATFDSVGFDVRSVAGSAAGTTAGPTLGYLALKLGDRHVDVRPYSTGTSTGSVAFSGIPFKPQALLAIGLPRASTTWADGTIDLLGIGGANGVSFVDESGFQAWNGFRERDNVGTTEAKSQLHATRAFHLANHTGADRFVAAWTAFGAGSFTLNVLTMTSGPHALLALTIEEATTSVFIGSGTGSAPLPAGVGTALEVFRGSGTGSAPRPVGVGTALEAFRGSGTGAAPLPAGEGTGLEVFRGSGTGVAPLPTAEATGVVVDTFAGDGTGSAPLPAGIGTGLEVFQGSGTGSAPLPTGSGTGLEVELGTGIGAAPLPTGTGTGLEVFQGSGTGSAPLPAGEGTGATVAPTTGDGTGVAPLPTGAGTGLEVFRGSGTGAAPLPAGEGTALEVFQGSGVSAAPLPTAAGAGLLAFLGSAAGVAPLPTGAGTGLEVFIGQGVGLAPRPVGVGTAFSQVFNLEVGDELDAGADFGQELAAGALFAQELQAGADGAHALAGGLALAQDFQASYDAGVELEAGAG